MAAFQSGRVYPPTIIPPHRGLVQNRNKFVFPARNEDREKRTIYPADFDVQREGPFRSIQEQQHRRRSRRSRDAVVALIIPENKKTKKKRKMEFSPGGRHVCKMRKQTQSGAILAVAGCLIFFISFGSRAKRELGNIQMSKAQLLRRDWGKFERDPAICK